MNESEYNLSEYTIRANDSCIKYDITSIMCKIIMIVSFDA